MPDSLFKEGGPHRIKRTGQDEYRFSIDIPTDSDGFIGRECINEDCSPGYFKVRPGTGIVNDQVEAFCPYCKSSGDPSDFATKAQVQYAKDIALREAQESVDRLVRNAFGIGPSGKKKMGGGFLSLELSYKPSRPRHVSRPFEEELRRDIVCPGCSLDHAVFGLAIWCPDCGRDIFLSHIEKEFEVIRLIMDEIENRREKLGARIAGRDIENCLEDIVSIFEAVMKFITQRYLLQSGENVSSAKEIIEKKIRNRYQSIPQAAKSFEKFTGMQLYQDIDQEDVESLASAFEKRHPIAHNLGIIDRKYLQRAMTGELEGREIRLNKQEVLEAAVIAHTIISRIYKRAFPSSTAKPSTQMDRPY